MVHRSVIYGQKVWMIWLQEEVDRNCPRHDQEDDEEERLTEKNFSFQKRSSFDR